MEIAGCIMMESAMLMQRLESGMNCKQEMLQQNSSCTFHWGRRSWVSGGVKKGKLVVAKAQQERVASKQSYFFFTKRWSLAIDAALRPD